MVMVHSAMVPRGGSGCTAGFAGDVAGAKTDRPSLRFSTIWSGFHNVDTF